jgi:hypothetical protein
MDIQLTKYLTNINEFSGDPNQIISDILAETHGLNNSLPTELQLPEINVMQENNFTKDMVGLILTYAKKVKDRANKTNTSGSYTDLDVKPQETLDEQIKKTKLDKAKAEYKLDKARELAAISLTGGANRSYSIKNRKKNQIGGELLSDEIKAELYSEVKAQFDAFSGNAAKINEYIKSLKNKFQQYAVALEQLELQKESLGRPSMLSSSGSLSVPMKRAASVAASPASASVAAPLPVVDSELEAARTRANEAFAEIEEILSVVNLIDNDCNNGSKFGETIELGFGDKCFLEQVEIINKEKDIATTAKNEASAATTKEVAEKKKDVVEEQLALIEDNKNDLIQLLADYIISKVDLKKPNDRNFKLYFSKYFSKNIKTINNLSTYVTLRQKASGAGMAAVNDISSDIDTFADAFNDNINKFVATFSDYKYPDKIKISSKEISVTQMNNNLTTETMAQIYTGESSGDAYNAYAMAYNKILISDPQGYLKAKTAGQDAAEKNLRLVEDAAKAKEATRLAAELAEKAAKLDEKKTEVDGMVKEVKTALTTLKKEIIKIEDLMLINSDDIKAAESKIIVEENNNFKRMKRFVEQLDEDIDKIKDTDDLDKANEQLTSATEYKTQVEAQTLAAAALFTEITRLINEKEIQNKDEANTAKAEATNILGEVSKILEKVSNNLNDLTKLESSYSGDELDKFKVVLNGSVMTETNKFVNEWTAEKDRILVEIKQNLHKDQAELEKTAAQTLLTNVNDNINKINENISQICDNIRDAVSASTSASASSASSASFPAAAPPPPVAVLDPVDAKTAAVQAADNFIDYFNDIGEKKSLSGIAGLKAIQTAKEANSKVNSTEIISAAQQAIIDYKAAAEKFRDKAAELVSNVKQRNKFIKGARSAAKAAIAYSDYILAIDSSADNKKTEVELTIDAAASAASAAKIPLVPFGDYQFGGFKSNFNEDPYYAKYMKYKAKYIKLKNSV